MVEYSDLESLLVGVKDYVKNNINTEITAYNSRKGDSILYSIDTNAHYLFLREMPPYNIFVNTYFEKLDTNSIGQDTAFDIMLCIEIAVADDGTDNAIIRGLRYNDVLKRLLEPKSIDFGSNIEQLVPVTIPLQGRALIVSGIKMKMSFI